MTHNTDDAKERDARRQQTLEQFGIVFLRFFDHDVVEHLDAVVRHVKSCVDERKAELL